jgi:hypothetical protein
MSDRITFDGDTDHLDEIVLSDALVHIERMSQHGWHIAIQAGARYISLSGADLAIVEDAGLGGLVAVAEPLLGCPVESGTHRCEEFKADHGGRHVCECGEVLR